METLVTKKAVQKDHSAAVDLLISEVRSTMKVQPCNEALEKLLSLEKVTRLDSDAVSTGRILECMVQLCAECGNWDTLCETLKTSTKKRGQMKQAVLKMVQKACEYLEKTPGMETKLKLLDTLRTVTEGKIYVEVERARLTRTLAKIRENEEKIDQAASILQELQVETFGSMDKREKIEFILEQMRLCLLIKDYMRAGIVCKKISTKYFQDPETEDLKLIYFKQKIELDVAEKRYLEVSKHYFELSKTKCVLADESKEAEALRYMIAYLILASFDNEQSDLLHRFLLIRSLEKLPTYLSILRKFTRKEPINWKNFAQKHEQSLRQDTSVFSTDALGEKRWNDLHKRIVEFNIRTMANFYTKIRVARMAELLDLDVKTAEETLSALVINNTIHAKIDRLEGVVHFVLDKQPTEVLNDWSSNINKLMSLINQANHLISKEKMVHQAQA